jgi:hypothetical protein
MDHVGWSVSYPDLRFPSDFTRDRPEGLAILECSHEDETWPRAFEQLA